MPVVSRLVRHESLSTVNGSTRVVSTLILTSTSLRTDASSMMKAPERQIPYVWVLQRPRIAGYES
jgi:hypothetical protein